MPHLKPLSWNTTSPHSTRGRRSAKRRASHHHHLIIFPRPQEATPKKNKQTNKRKHCNFKSRSSEARKKILTASVSLSRFYLNPAPLFPSLDSPPLFPSLDSPPIFLSRLSPSPLPFSLLLRISLKTTGYPNTLKH